MTEDQKTKKAMILETAREIGAEKWTPAEIDQLRRKLIAEHGEDGKTGSEYVADVLKSAGLKVNLSQLEEVEDQFEEEFEDLLHFKTLADAEVSLMRLDELWRRFQTHGEKTAAGRVLEVARLGKCRCAQQVVHAADCNRGAVGHLLQAIHSLTPLYSNL